MNYFIIAGEASGDLHGSNLMRGLRKADRNARFKFWGGDLMAEVGGEENLLCHYKKNSFFGFWEIVRNCRTILSRIGECERQIEQTSPDVLILIDYPGFNLRMARFAHSRGLKVCYYISPKVWAWKEHRVRLISRYVDRLYVIFPFEVDWFARRGLKVTYEGNPTVDSIDRYRSSIPDRDDFFAANSLDNRPVVALLSGSRRTEIRNNLPFMKALSERFKDRQFVVAAVSWIDRDLYTEALAGSDVKVVFDATYPLLSFAEAAVVCSGTATLEAALLGVPEVVCYHADNFSVWVARNFIKVRFISLVNIILDRHSVVELIQRDMNVDMAACELGKIVEGGSERERMLTDFADLARLLGQAGSSDRVARRIVEEFGEQSRQS